MLFPAAPRMPRELERWLAGNRSVTCREPTLDELLTDSESPIWGAAVCWTGKGTGEVLAAVPWLRQFRDLPVVVVGRGDTAGAAVDAFKHGACNYVAFRRSRKAPLIDAVERAGGSWGIGRSAACREAVDERAAGIAHAINNVLAIIGGECECALDHAPTGDPSRDAFRMIHAACRRGAALTGQLLPFGRARPPTPKVLDLNALVAGMEPVLRRLVGEQIEFLVRLAPDLWPVKADAGDMEQVVMNLVMNARDAIRRHGTIAVETSNTRRKGPPAGKPGSPSGDRVLLAVSDSGCGMDKETRSRLFEPFFTTKKPGRGNGLGLARVHAAVDGSGGLVKVHSKPGQGTKFTIQLPRAGEGLPDAEAAATRRRNDALLSEKDEEGAPSGLRGAGRHGGGALRDRTGDDGPLVRERRRRMS